MKFNQTGIEKDVSTGERGKQNNTEATVIMSTQGQTQDGGAIV